MQIVPELLPAPSTPTAVKERHDDGMTLTSHSAYNPGPYGTYWDSHAAFDPPWTLCPTRNSSDRHLLPHSVEQDIRDPKDHLHDEPSAYRSLSHATYSHYQSASKDHVADSFIPQHLPSNQSFRPSLPYWFPRPTPTGYLETDPRSRVMLPQDSIVSSRRRRGARAIEYGGLWIDEQELLEGLTEHNGQLNVHQCFWKEDRSPCHLWIKGDKSSINAHIQKWHRGRPGGEKLKADCRWFTCRKTILKESISRHILSIHLGETWKCQGCGKAIARKDVYVRHVERSDFEGCRTAGALITYSADVRVIDARAALDSGGSLRYADA